VTPGQQAWARASLALDLLATNPERLKGITVRARSGPVRDVFLEMIERRLGPVQKLHPAMSRDALIGGLDFAQTLATGTLTKSEGLLEKTGTLLLTMAERCPPDVAALIASRLDTNSNLTLILLDEGAESDETAPPALMERLAFHVSLDGVGRLEAKAKMRGLPKAQSDTPIRSSSGRKPDPVVVELTTLAAQLGIDTLRAPSFAVDTAYLNARIHDRQSPDTADLTVAAELVLAPRATRLPEIEPPPPDAPQEPTDAEQKTQTETLPEDMLIDAVRTVLPQDLLENLSISAASGARGSGAGQRKKGNRRGRPLQSRPGRLDGTSRLDLVATLRAAAPWQTLRGKTRDGPVRVYPSDVHLKKYEDRSDRLIIFAVDASGSAALARLGEAKGAVELLLARAYASRDHVALIAFRGDDAQLLLPPTRSLVQTKRRLAELPGGGGTPLAHGLQSAADLAQRSNSQGLSPLIAVLTDGRANIALDGSANRDLATQDAERMARWIRATRIPAIVLDVGKRAHPSLSKLATEMGARYMPLPQGTAERMSETLGAAMDHGLGA